MAGREALVEAATSTANSGYKMRLSVKKMEHSTLQYDHTVRDRDGTIIQFLYGDDGLNQKFVASNQLPWCSTTLLKLASYTPQCDI
jgi:DNA-directed RNA polymerase beta' subunit